MNTININPGSALQAGMMQEMNRMATIADSPILPAANITTSATSLASSSSVSFNQIMDSALKHVDQLQHTAETRQNAIDMGKSDDLAGAMIASQQASLSFSALVQVRNKVATGINDLMSMSV